MPTFRDYQVVHRHDYKAGEDLETLLNERRKNLVDDGWDEEGDNQRGSERNERCPVVDDGEGDGRRSHIDDDDNDDEDPTHRYKRLYYSMRQSGRSPMLTCLMGYAFGGIALVAFGTMTGLFHSFNEPLDVDQGIDQFQQRLFLSNITQWCRHPSIQMKSPSDHEGVASYLDRMYCPSCTNPLLPRDRKQDKPKKWVRAHQQNLQRLLCRQVFHVRLRSSMTLRYL